MRAHVKMAALKRAYWHADDTVINKVNFPCGRFLFVRHVVRTDRRENTFTDVENTHGEDDQENGV